MTDGVRRTRIFKILKWSSIGISLQFILLMMFLFGKEIIEWADKPADNASVVLIVVVVFYIFSLPITSKLNKILNMIDVAISDETDAVEDSPHHDNE